MSKQRCTICNDIDINIKYSVSDDFYCNHCMEEKILCAMKNNDMTSLAEVVNAHAISSIGFVKAYLESCVESTFDYGYFAIDEIEDVNARGKNNYLLIDLWFSYDKTSPKGVLSERVVEGSLQVKQTVRIEQLDYITSNKNRKYW